MRQISLRLVQLAQFRSFVQPTNVEFDSSPGLRLVTGSNLAEPRLGANGVGKSTLFDAVCYCLYGTSIRGLRASDLISHGCDKCEVAVTLLVDGEEHRVHRTSPPVRLYLDGEQVDQADVEELVGLSRPRFLNSVVFGQAVPLFLDLPVPARGDLLDEVLDLELWMEAAESAGKRHTAKSRDLTTLRTEMAHLQGQIEGLPDLTDLKMRERAWSKEHAVAVADHEETLGLMVEALAELERESQAEPVLADETALKSAYDKLQAGVGALRERRAAMRAEEKRLGTDLEFFSDNTDCPTCGTPLDDPEAHATHVEEQLEDLGKTLLEVEMKIQESDTPVQAAQSAWQQAVQSNAAARREHQLRAGQVRDRRTDLERARAQLSRLREEVNPHTASRISTVERRRALRQQVGEKVEHERILLADLTALEYWRGGFRKVRLFCLERVLRELTVESGNALAALGLVGWEVRFSTATETRSGTVKLGVQAEVKRPGSDGKLDALSGGESQRARLAVSLGLANLIQRWAGVRWSLEVFDEPTAWLSEQGVEDLLEALSSRAADHRRSIWICDHRSLASGKFDGVMQIEKDARGSRVAVPDARINAGGIADAVSNGEVLRTERGVELHVPPAQSGQSLPLHPRVRARRGADVPV